MSNLKDTGDTQIATIHDEGMVTRLVGGFKKQQLDADTELPVSLPSIGAALHTHTFKTHKTHQYSHAKTTNHPKRRMKPTDQNKTACTAPSLDSEALERVLNPNDVLLERTTRSKPPIGKHIGNITEQLRRHFQRRGQPHYQEQLRFYHPIYVMTNNGSPSSEEHIKSLVWGVLESVWAKDGRFLAFDDKTCSLALVDNETAFRLVRNGLQQRPPPTSLSKTDSKKKKRMKRNKKNGSKKAASSSKKARKMKKPAKATASQMRSRKPSQQQTC